MEMFLDSQGVVINSQHLLLCQSKLFYLPMFNLQLKQIESERVRNIRLINVVTLENIPQLAIQLVYLF